MSKVLRPQRDLMLAVVSKSFKNVCLCDKLGELET